MRLAPIAIIAALAAAPSAAQELSPSDRALIDQRIRAYLLENPELIIEAMRVLEARQAEAQARDDARLIADNADALFADGFSGVIGAPDADVTIVEFFDYRCGYCKAAHPELTRLIEEDGGVRVVLKEFPILGPESLAAARVAMAALEVAPDAYPALFDALMDWRGQMDEEAALALAREQGLDAEALRSAMSSGEITRRIRANHALARELGVQGTPAFVIGDRILRGYAPIETMREMVAEARAR